MYYWKLDKMTRSDKHRLKRILDQALSGKLFKLVELD